MSDMETQILKYRSECITSAMSGLAASSENKDPTKSRAILGHFWTFNTLGHNYTGHDGLGVEYVSFSSPDQSIWILLFIYVGVLKGYAAVV